MCSEFYDATSRYERSTKTLTFFLVCPVCRVEKVVDTLEYEPKPILDVRSPVSA